MVRSERPVGGRAKAAHDSAVGEKVGKGDTMALHSCERFAPVPRGAEVYARLVCVLLIRAVVYKRAEPAVMGKIKSAKAKQIQTSRPWGASEAQSLWQVL